MAGLAPFEPKPAAVPFRWAYERARALLLEAGRRITAEEAERRVLVLGNPGVDGGLQVTDTLYAGLQLILPGEIAPPHRHTQSALRFVMEGQGAFTAVDGTRVAMAPGDFIVTPAWTWHEHGGGPEAVIWMDGLDVGLVGFLHAGFREEGPASAMPAAPAAETFAWPYAQSRAALFDLAQRGDPDPHASHVLHYRQPDGAPAMPTIAASLRLLPEGFSTLPYKSTDGMVISVVEGRIDVRAGGETLALGPKDIAALPGWTTYTLEAIEESVVFGFSDRPAHEALGLFREWRGREADRR
jgi:gentisate 1,2-dioxygenase